LHGFPPATRCILSIRKLPGLQTAIQESFQDY
jgi:hypothetical protein